MLKNAGRCSRLSRLGVVFSLLCAPHYAAAATLKVNANGGADAGTCIAPAAPCLTITYAIGLSAAGDTIRVADGVYQENNISIPHDLAVIGDSPLTTEIDGQGNRIFSINANLVRISRFTLRNGNAGLGGNGGAIDFSGGQLFVTNCRLLDNDATLGGAINVNDSALLTVSGSTISGNNATSRGGAISCVACGGIDLLRNRLLDNTAGVYGGAIYAEGNGMNFLRITTVLSSLLRNTADSGGAIYASASEVHIYDSRLEINEADGAATGEGGAVYSTSTLNIQRSTFESNTALNNGGAIAVFGGGQLYSANSTFSQNSASAGGAISLLSNFGVGPLATIGTATFFGNDCLALGLGCAGHISHGGPSTLRLYNSIITGGVAAKCFSAAANGTHNLIDDNSCNSGAATFNLGVVTGLNPTLAFNGGPTRTHDLNANSNAIDTGRNAACLNPWTVAPLVQDQRGQPRPVDYPGVGPAAARCDIGAVEKQ